MGAVVKAVTSVAKAVVSVATVAVKATVKVGGVVLEAASPITKVVAGALKATLDNTLGRVLPTSIYSKISGFTNAGAAIAEGHLTTENFRGVVKGFMDVGLIGVRISKEATGLLAATGIGKSIDKYSGGLLTSVHNLERVAITMENNGLTDNYEKINWKATLIDAIKVGAAIASGGTAISVMMASNVVGDTTGLNKTSLGAGLLTAGAMLATGTASFTQVATQGGAQIGTKAVLNNTSLGDSELGRTALTLGVTATVNSIQANTAFSDEMRNLAEAKVKEIATTKANQELQQATGLPINVNMLESAYAFSQSDKTISQILGEAQDKYTKKYTELMTKIENTSVNSLVESGQNKLNVLADKAANISEEDVMDLASKEADKYVLDQLEAAKNKYGQKLFDYLVSKYGPQTDYDNFATPDDFLNYQIFTPPANKRIVNIVYKKPTGKIIGGVLVAGAVLGVVALS